MAIQLGLEMVEQGLACAGKGIEATKDLDIVQKAPLSPFFAKMEGQPQGWWEAQFERRRLGSAQVERDKIWGSLIRTSRRYLLDIQARWNVEEAIRSAEDVECGSFAPRGAVRELNGWSWTQGVSYGGATFPTYYRAFLERNPLAEGSQVFAQMSPQGELYVGVEWDALTPRSEMDVQGINLDGIRRDQKIHNNTTEWMQDETFWDFAVGRKVINHFVGGVFKEGKLHPLFKSDWDDRTF